MQGPQLGVGKELPQNANDEDGDDSVRDEVSATIVKVLKLENRWER